MGKKSRRKKENPGMGKLLKQLRMSKLVETNDERGNPIVLNLTKKIILQEDYSSDYLNKEKNRMVDRIIRQYKESLEEKGEEE